MSDVVDDRNNIINSYGDIFDSMLSPVGFTFNLKRSKRIRLEDNSRRTITLEDKHLNISKKSTQMYYKTSVSYRWF